ncbi:MAG TPA: hypothetical protein VFP53_02500 [Sphingomicrobium sp.]|nr:hypothetical protein [Sphingomicrobium sp.]
MTYGLSPTLFVEDGPAVHAVANAAERRSDRFRAWRNLDSTHRLELIERAMNAPANDLLDAYPIAL